VNALYRLRTLGILEYFERLYALEGRLTPHPDPNWKPAPLPKPNFVTEVPLSERKPNPALLHDICRHEGVSPNEAWYVGDSLTRDIAMARAAGITAAWAKYGTQYDPALWRVLVRVTHWSAEDVAREAELKKLASQVQPDFSLDAYSDILKYAELPPQESDLS
jgi:phosphoglycolate phosphatase